MATNILICKLPVNYQSDASLRAKITEIDALINELLNTAMKSVTQGNIAEYELDTGQTRTRIKYTSVGSITQAVTDYKKLRQMYVNELNRTTGHVRLVGEQNFKNRYRG